MTPERMVERAKIQLLDRCHFFGRIACDLKWYADKSIPTACTDGRSIRWNPDWLAGLTDEQRIFVAAHEVLHVVRRHHTRMGERIPLVWNIATDHVINTELVEYKLGEPPEGGLCDQKYNGRLEEDVYRELMQDAKVVKLSTAGNGQGDPGNCGGVEKPTSADGSGREPTSAELQAENQRLDRIIERAAIVAKQRGDGKGVREEYIPSRREHPLDWRQVLQEFVTPLMPTDVTWERFNRRLWHSGVYAPGVLRDGIGPVAVCMDTSGSITREMVETFLGELLALLGDCSPERLDLFYFHSEVYQHDTIGAGDEYAPPMVESGGTSFRNAFQAVADLEDTPKCLIMLTDMYDTIPPEPEYPVLWIATTDEVAPYGRTVRLVP